MICLCIYDSFHIPFHHVYVVYVSFELSVGHLTALLTAVPQTDFGACANAFGRARADCLMRKKGKKLYLSV